MRESYPGGGGGAFMAMNMQYLSLSSPMVLRRRDFTWPSRENTRSTEAVPMGRHSPMYRSLWRWGQSCRLMVLFSRNFAPTENPSHASLCKFTSFTSSPTSLSMMNLHVQHAVHVPLQQGGVVVVPQQGLQQAHHRAHVRRQAVRQ
eukprot:TRINITY_DN2957_c0_g1_i17.p1 TRINITY_DN2957_c0_g1~~TRINITY_DN2957_c0_g1_i17.p1  ORF type:complete len:146 (+),score=3.18 TRINITY_DN2957_c0_g1_i17:45-482(+)